ncbi:hypothetical protein FB451DRAFT_1212957 [Mycena latifolia]|nr:hypothetical protein FB451DRAFT_1212957 [Mycena latifolia]
MNHPYSGAASYIYANEHPYTPVDPRSKDPYSKLPSFVPSPSSITSSPSPHRSHDSGWSTEGTYARTQRPEHDAGDSRGKTMPFRRGLSQSVVPRIPLRAPISYPHQQRNASVSVSWFEDPTEDTEGHLHPQMRSTSLPGHSRTQAPTLKITPSTYIHPTTRSTSLPGHSRSQAPKSQMRMTPYALDGDPLSLRRSEFVPLERAEAGAKPSSWRTRFQVALEQRRIRRAIRRLRRLMRFKS